MHYTNAIVVVGFTFIHYFSKFFHLNKHSLIAKFSSLVGGVSIAYVFFHLLPSLIHYQADISTAYNLSATGAFQLLFATILFGLIVFYFLEVAMESSRLTMTIKRINNQDMSDASFEEAHQRVFWAHMAPYAIYNIIVGILLADQSFESTATALIYLMVIGLHLFTNDWVLRHHFTQLYDKFGRGIITFTVLLGWTIGFAFQINHIFIALLEAFVAGGIILNAIKDELPECKGSNFPLFLMGTAAYSLFLIFI